MHVLKSEVPTTSFNPQTKFLPLENVLPEEPESDASDLETARYVRELRTVRDARRRWNDRFTEDGYSYHIREDGEGNTAFFWDSNDRPVPLSVFADAGMRPVSCGVTMESQRAAVDHDNEAFLREHRQRRQTLTPEQRFEMRAAFGSGETVVNASTGETYTT
jgi:glycine/D-amino acid oxidase-like deaminating enzyme